MSDEYHRMKANFEEEKVCSKPNICPHLALKGDVESYAAFPSVINACHRGPYSITPKISHQNTFCLGQNFLNCPIFQNDPGKKFPRDLQYRHVRFPGRTNKFIVVGLFAILILSLGLFFIFREGIETESFWIFPKEYGPITSSSEEVIYIESSTITPQIEDLFHSEFTAVFTEALPTVTPTEPAQREIDPVLALDTPIGGEHHFLIHRVLEGESLQYLADLHKTTREAILAVNADMITPLWVDWIVVIPVNTEDVGKFPKFSAFQIKEEGITLVTIADKFEGSVEEMSLYNNIDPEHILHEGEWILVPRN